LSFNIKKIIQDFIQDLISLSKGNLFVENLEKTRLLSTITSNAPLRGYELLDSILISELYFLIIFETRSNSGP
tara:strand:+ start:1888 stop:2106 length:219 start_codon:yes stop_codon:yes gene_type:complete